MGNLGFGFPTTGSLQEAFEDTPQGFRQFVRTGFAALAKVHEDKWAALLAIAGSSLEEPSDMEVEYISERFGIAEGEVLGLLGATRLICGVLSSRKEEPKELTQAAVAAKTLEETDAETILRIAAFAAKTREELKRKLERGVLGSSVLPSLSEFDLRVDVRLHFVQGAATVAAPVVIARLVTDEGGPERHFQMTPFQIEALQATLQAISRQLAAAETIAIKAV